MKYLYIILAFFCSSCFNSNLNHYYAIIRDASRITIFYKGTGNTVKLNIEEVEIFKEILLRNIEPGNKNNHEPEIQIEFCKQDKLTGILVISNADAHFKSKDIELSFPLTYGIDRFLVELPENRLR